mgnify:CR=1 FL=1
MHPTLFVDFIHTYGLMLAVGFYAAWWLGGWRAKAAGVHPDVIGNMVLISILAGVVGARLLWFALYREPGDSVFVLFEVWRGGLVFYGGLIAAVVADYAYLKRKRLPVWQVADLVAPAVSLGQAFGRIGCFLNGCCFGGLCGPRFPLGVRFPAFRNAAGAPVGAPAFLDHVHRGWVADNAAASLPVHPTQLYESASLFLITGLLIVFSPYKRRHGQVFALLCILNAVSRLGVELVRGDTTPIFLGLNPGQVGAACVLAIGLAILLWVSRRGEAPSWQS